MVVEVMALALSLSILAQAIIFFLILRDERKIVKDLLNRLASRTLGEYVQATKILESKPEKEENREEEGPIPIFS